MIMVLGLHRNIDSSCLAWGEQRAGPTVFIRVPYTIAYRTLLVVRLSLALCYSGVHRCAVDWNFYDILVSMYLLEVLRATIPGVPGTD